MKVDSKKQSQQEKQDTPKPDDEIIKLQDDAWVKAMEKSRHPDVERDI